MSPLGTYCVDQTPAQTNLELPKTFDERTMQACRIVVARELGEHCNKVIKKNTTMLERKFHAETVKIKKELFASERELLAEREITRQLRLEIIENKKDNIWLLQQLKTITEQMLTIMIDK